MHTEGYEVQSGAVPMLTRGAAVGSMTTPPTTPGRGLHVSGPRGPLGVATRVDDIRVVLSAHYAGRCASCGSAYASGARIGHSRVGDGWVAACCAPDLEASTSA